MEYKLVFCVLIPGDIFAVPLANHINAGPSWRILIQCLENCIELGTEACF
jgi:hypothetical protein